MSTDMPKRPSSSERMRSLRLVKTDVSDVSTDSLESNGHRDVCPRLLCSTVKVGTYKTNLTEPKKCTSATKEWSSDTSTWPKLRPESWDGERTFLSGWSNSRRRAWMVYMIVIAPSLRICLRLTMTLCLSLILMIMVSPRLGISLSVVGTVLITVWSVINYLRSRGFLTTKQIRTSYSTTQIRQNLRSGGNLRSESSVRTVKSSMRLVDDTKLYNDLTTRLLSQLLHSIPNPQLETKSRASGINLRKMTSGLVTLGLLSMFMTAWCALLVHVLSKLLSAY